MVRSCRWAEPVSLAVAIGWLLLLPPAVAQYDDPPIGDPPSSGSCPSGTTKVTLSGMSFSPSSITVTAGTKVCWQNDNGEHTVTSNTGAFGSGLPAAAVWNYSYTFDTPGTYPYHCQVHGSPSSGMRGTVVVSGPDPVATPGSLRFSSATYTAGEGSAIATITVNRVNGDDGAVSAAWSATAGSATAGSDFSAGNGTLNWADNDDAGKTFTVGILNDSAVENNETVNLTLSSPTGGAVLDASLDTAILTIQDNDAAPPGGTPAAPSNLSAAADPDSSTEIVLNWTDNANNETGFRVEERMLAGSFQEVASLAANTTSHIFVAAPASFHLFRVRASGSGGVFSAYATQAFASANAVAAPCLASLTTACVNNSNFQIEVDWRTSEIDGDGSSVALPSAPDSALFYFFNSGNIEQLVKVLNGCAINERYWLFYAATTNVEFALIATDTRNGRTKSYFNPLNQAAAPVQDVSAFATCP